MIFKIHRRDCPFAQIDRKTLEDPRVSWKAKGLLVYLISRPDDWTVKVEDVARRSTDKHTAIYSALKELEDCKYARFEEIREKGRFISRKWHIYETPILNKDESEAGNPLLANPLLANPSHTNNDKNKEEEKHARQGQAPATECERLITKCAKKLEEFLRSNHKLNGNYSSLPKWEKQIRWLLNRDLEGDSARLGRVARGYCTKSYEFKPTVHSAYQFRDKFFQIENWLNRYEPAPPPERVHVRFGQKEIIP